MRVKFLRLLPTAFVPLWVAYDLWHSDRTHIKCASNSARFFCVCVCVCVMSVRSVSTVNPLILSAVSSLFRYHFQLFMNATACHLLWNVCQCVCMCVCIHSLCYYDQKRIYSVFIFLFTRFFTQFFDSRWSSCLFMKCTSILLLKCPPWVSFLFIFYLTIVRTKTCI